MLIKNWMKKSPATITSDTPASEALRILGEIRERFIPVVDEGRLRGILSRKDLNEAASSVTATQSPHEMKFFNERVKVKDLMVRKPVCLSMDDTVEAALEQGKQFGRSFFPVMDGEKLVGTVSDLDIFNSLYQILGVAESYSGLTVELDRPDGEMVREIVEAAFAAGGRLHCLFTLKDPETGKRRLLLRLDKEGLERVNETLKERGFNILEVVRRNG